MVSRSWRPWLLAISVGLGLSAEGSALADPPSNAGSGSTCVVSGSAYAPKDTAIMSAATGGVRVGVFSGAIAPMKATNFPADASTGRMQVNTGAGFRVEGFSDPRAIPMFTTRDVSVVAGHVWISGGRQVKVAGAAPGQLRVEIGPRGAISRAVSATAGCEAFSYGKTTSPVYSVPGYGRGYVARQGSLDLYGSASGDLVHTLQLSGEGNGLLMWGQEVRGQYVHVTARFELYIDAWVKVSDVRALPQGEMMDQTAPSEIIQNPPTLAIKDYKAQVRAPKNVTLRASRGDAGTPIGEIESGTEVYVLDVTLGWATVIPKSLHVMPPDDKAFWAKSADLGIAPPASPK